MTDLNSLSSELCDWMALFLPAALLLLRWFSPRHMPWWLFVVSVVLGVWGLVCLSGVIYYHHAMQVLNDFKGGPPPVELIHNATSDAGFMVILRVGFILGPLFASPWLLIYAVSQLIAGKIRKIPSNCSNPPVISP